MKWRFTNQQATLSPLSLRDESSADTGILKRGFYSAEDKAKGKQALRSLPGGRAGVPAWGHFSRTPAQVASTLVAGSQLHPKVFQHASLWAAAAPQASWGSLVRMCAPLEVMSTVCSNWADLKRGEPWSAGAQRLPPHLTPQLPLKILKSAGAEKQTPLVVQRDRSPPVLQDLKFRRSLGDNGL